MSVASNNTGRPEQVLPWGGPGSAEPVGGKQTVNVTVEIGSGGGSSQFETALLQWIKGQVRVRGGGSVQKALGNHEILY